MEDAEGTDAFLSLAMRSLFEPGAARKLADRSRRLEQCEGVEPMSEVRGADLGSLIHNVHCIYISSHALLQPSLLV